MPNKAEKLLLLLETAFKSDDDSTNAAQNAPIMLDRARCIGVSASDGKALPLMQERGPSSQLRSRSMFSR